MCKAMGFFAATFVFFASLPSGWTQERVMQAWVATYNGPAGNVDRANAVTMDRFGNVYVTGRSQTGLQWDRPFGGGPEGDIATVKYDGNGNLQWVARFDGDRSETDDDESVAIAVDSQENVYVTGHTGASFESDFITIKYEADGREAWVARHGVEHQTDHARDLEVDGEGSVYVTGSAYSQQMPDIITVKYDTEGRMVWTAEHEPDSEYEYATVAWTPQALALGPQATTIVVGNICDLNSPHFCDILILVYDAGGVLIRATRDERPDTHEEPISFAVDGDGLVAVTGFIRSLGQEHRILTAKYAVAGSGSLGNGRKLWEAIFGGGEVSFPVGLALDAGGKVAVGGWSRQGSDVYVALKYDARGAEVMHAVYDDPETEFNQAGAMAMDRDGAIYLTGKTGNTTGRRDLLTVKFDPDGNEAWVARLRENFENLGNAITVADDGRVVVAGETGVSHGDFVTVSYSQSPARFWRGDVDADGARNLTDAVSLLHFLFLGAGPPPCQGSADTNDDGALGLTDAVFLLNFLFAQGPAPDAGSPGCATDSTPDSLGCEAPGACP